jgi:hypothetical protein
VKNKHTVANKKPKNTLRLPDLDHAKSAVLNSLPSKESQRGYRHSIEEFIAWYCSEPRLSFNKAVQLVSKIPQHDFHASESHHAQEIVDVVLVARNQAAKHL